MANNDKLHIAMFPWLGFGHILPYLELAKLLAQKGHKVSFISTPGNINRLPKLPPNLESLINFIKLPLPQVPNLPIDAEATTDVPFNKVKYLKIGYDHLQLPISHFLENSSPDWILYDFAAYWLGPIASRFNVGCAYFSIFLAAQLGYMGPPSVLADGQDDRVKPEDFIVKPKWIPFETSVGIQLFEMKRIFANLANEDGNVSDMYRFGNAVKGCDIVAIRSCSEFEPEWLKLLEDIYRKPVVPVGLLPSTVYDGADHHGNETWRQIKEWLDKQKKGSVVYVAFGSETKPSQDELTELALGLELSKLPFFWVLIKQRGSADTEPTQLPDGFEERTKGRGVVCTSWAPQLKILSHDSVGGLLIHSGWSSAVEAIQFERALILLPFLADQGLIARLLEEKKMAYSIPRDEGDGSFTRDSVAESLRLVMVEEEGKIYRDKVKEMKGLFADRDRQDRYVDNLLAYLQSHRKLER